jgi:plasmid stabilization system protein ParE
VGVQVVVSLRARFDILGIHSYLAERSPAAADRMLTRFSQRFDELREFRFSGRTEANFERRCEGSWWKVISPFTW